MKKGNRAYHRKFRGIPVQEARAALHVQPNKADIQGATREDPENCAYARALKRTLDCKNVFVFSMYAYIETLNETGNRIMERYVVRKYAKEYLLRFDGGEKIEPGGFVFHPPNRSKTLAYKMKDYWDRKRRGMVSRRRTGATAMKPKTYSLRNGKGAVHFITGEEIKVRRPD
jgi:hypothetical protein